MGKKEKKETKDSIEIIIETPKGSRNKYKYNEKKEIFKLDKILPVGFSFPFDFGIIPKTKGDDGDPLDIILITQQSTFTGCHIDSRIVGGIKANQTEEGKTIRNDRFFAVPLCDDLYASVQDVHDLPREMVNEIGEFFMAYHKLENVDFVPQSLLKAQEVKKIIKSSR